MNMAPHGVSEIIPEFLSAAPRITAPHRPQVQELAEGGAEAGWRPHIVAVQRASGLFGSVPTGDSPPAPAAPEPESALARRMLDRMKAFLWVPIPPGLVLLALLIATRRR